MILVSDDILIIPQKKEMNAQMAQATQKIYYTLKEVRDLFGDAISETSLLTMVRRNEIPTRRMMSRIFVPQWWVQQLIEEATQPPKK